MTPLVDVDARRRALTVRDRSLLVEAGAGSGKTALMAGRVALLLAEGVPPTRIAAITFTELAAAELADRVHRFVHELLDGIVDPAMAPALPLGPDAGQLAHLRRAAADLDHLTCTTIHGFARDLVQPYPVEANVDPGATVLDAAAAALAFDDAFDAWLVERLGGDRPDPDDVVAGLVMVDPAAQVTWLRGLAALVRDHPGAHRPAPPSVAPALRAAVAAGRACESHVHQASFAAPPDAIERAGCWAGLADRWLGQDGGEPRTDVAHLLAVLRDRPQPVCNASGGVAAYRLKGAWEGAARAAGASKAAGTEAFDRARALNDAAKEAFEALLAAAADHVLARALQAVGEVRARYRTHKREAAQLDFDDLLATAVGLLRAHPSVRDSLADRYPHVLVDEFQDTDPIQAEIVWRLTGAPVDPGSDWRSWPSRPGARFVVGDPKQSIYRFRRADVATYTALRTAMEAAADGERLSISVNFRSRSGIIELTNRTFAAPLAAPDQPGYGALAPFRTEPGAAVRTLTVAAPDGSDPTKSVHMGAARRAEAAAVADVCARLIAGEEDLLDRAVAAGDIALLAPTGTELAIYERALEDRGIAVASQAGKGFFRRQEVQDLVALTRVLADGRDRTALGALLRGPLVGATDEALLDVAEALHRAEASVLNVFTEPELVPDPIVRRALERLGPLARRARGTTPYALLSDALERLEVRAVLIDRHRGHADRPLANVALFLERSRPYAARGLRAFAQDVWKEWDEETGTVEGRPDEEQDAVTLITVHSAKGLEWPVVIPVNTFGAPRGSSSPTVDRSTHVVETRVLGVATGGLKAALEAESASEAAERIRLWYVAATRACDLLVVPVPAFEVGRSCWHHMIAWDFGDIEPIRVLERGPTVHRPMPADGPLDEASYVAEAARIDAARPRIERLTPSRHEAHDAAGEDAASEDFAPVVALAGSGEAVRSDDERAFAPPLDLPPVRGAGATRGLLLHKLLEELVTGELADADAALDARAHVLLDQLGVGDGPDAAEVAASARRAWTLPEVADLHGRLVAELDVAGRSLHDGVELLTHGVADAVAYAPDGTPEVVVDWKSDVAPRPATVDAYREQVRAYVRLLGAREGWLVFATGGRIERIMGG
jgi:ATP-dependent exoDNAse (exonuclease V) beta subunit